MMKDFTIESLYNLKHTIAGELFEGKTYPWEVLSEIRNFVIQLGKKLDPEEYELRGENIWIAKTAKVAPTACINGPAIIGKNTEVRHAAFVRGSAIIGDDCVIGNSTEVKNSIIFDRVQAPHYNYIGDSIIGYKSHMGAGAICSNVKADRRIVTIRVGEELVSTGLKKVGGMVGDHVEVGCGTVLNPGTVVGMNTNIYPLCSVRGWVPADSIYKGQDAIIPKRRE